MDTAFSGTEESRIVPTTGFRLAEHNGQDWPLVEECQRIASRNLSLSFTGYPSAFSLIFLLSLSPLQVSSLVSPLGLPRCWLVPLLLHHLSTPLGGRTNGRAKLAARGFPIFHQEVGFKYLCPLSLSLSLRPFLLAAPPWNKTTATENWCFSLQIRPIFHRVPPRATCLGGPTCLPLTRDFFLSLLFPFPPLSPRSFSFAHRLEARLPWRASYVRINRSTRVAPSFPRFYK